MRPSRPWYLTRVNTVDKLKAGSGWKSAADRCSGVAVCASSTYGRMERGWVPRVTGKRLTRGCGPLEADKDSGED